MTYSTHDPKQEEFIRKENAKKISFSFSEIVGTALVSSTLGMAIGLIIGFFIGRLIW